MGHVYNINWFDSQDGSSGFVNPILIIEVRVS